MTDDARHDTEPAGTEPSRWRPVLGRCAVVLSWGVVFVLAWIALSIAVGSTAIAPITVPLQSLVPFVFVPAWIVGAVAFGTRRWFLGAACAALAVGHVALVLPALGSDAIPPWAAAAPTITLFSANLYNRNASPDAAAARVLASDADVLTLVEVSARVHDALVRRGVDERFPYQVLSRASPAGETDGVYSRFPFTSEGRLPLLQNREPVVTLTVAGRPVTVIAVHIDGSRHSATTWREELRLLAGPIRATRGALVISGDFNATRWNPPLRDLLALHMTDAHEARGRGLSRSWPARGGLLAAFGPLMRLDHALVDDRVAVEAVRDVRVPGSDHVAFEVRLAIGR